MRELIKSSRKLTPKVIAVFIMLMPGCATISYQEPIDGERSRVRFSTNSSDITVVRHYSNSDCDDEEEWMRLRDGPLLRADEKSLDMPLNDYGENASKEFYVRAGKEMFFLFKGSFSLGNVIHYCGVPVRYAFEANRDYELSYKLEGPERFPIEGCVVELSKIVKTEGGYAKHNIQIFDNTLPDFGKGCLDAFKKLRWF